MTFKAILFLNLFAATAAAQTALTPQNAPIFTQFTRADTVRALHNLFKSKRSTGGWLAYGSAGVIAIAALGTLEDYNGRGYSSYLNPNAREVSILFGIALTPAWIPGTISLIRFTKKREQKAIEEFERTKKIPHNLRKKLKRRFFNTNYRFSKPS